MRPLPMKAIISRQTSITDIDFFGHSISLVAVGKPIIAKLADVTSRATAYLTVCKHCSGWADSHVLINIHLFALLDSIPSNFFI